VPHSDAGYDERKPIEHDSLTARVEAESDNGFGSIGAAQSGQVNPI